MTNPVFCCYVTVPDKVVAESVARALVDEGLAACVNVFDGATSFFRWKGESDVAQELVLIMKTSQIRLQEMTARVLELHPHECPCVVSWKIEQGAPPFLDWVRAQTGGEERGAE